MKTTRLRAMLIAFAVLTLIAASLACREEGPREPLPTPYVPPTATPETGPPPTPSGDGGPNLVITGVTLSTNTPAKDGWVVVDVTIQNQGGAAADGFELVLIPHYGWGPPNPAGYEVLPSIAPGATHSVTFTPGVLYSDVGTFTLRVLVTDDWYATGNPDSTGSAGDVWDETITVSGVPVTEGPDLVITSATLSSSTPGVDEWVTVDVTIANEGMAVATEYQLVVIPHYGVGPPNPGGYEDLPDLAPGDTYATTITPGLLYPSPGSYTVRVLVTDDWYALGSPDSTGLGGDYQDLPITVAGPTEASGPNLVITGVTLSTNAPPKDGWVVVDVTIQNQGGAAADGFELVLIPHYGWGPPNPAGYEELPSIAPGASRGVTFSPGVLYSDVGTFTLRVLVTDDWYATGNPDSTGSAGDLWDETITVGGG